MSALQFTRDPITKKPIVNAVTVYTDITRNKTAPTKSAGSSVISVMTLTVNNVPITSALQSALQVTTGVTAGIAMASKALTLDSAKSATGVRTFRCAELVINGTVLDPSIFASSVVVSSDNASNPFLTYSNLGLAQANKAWILDKDLTISGINTLNVKRLNAGRRILTNAVGNDVIVNSLATLPQMYRPDVSTAIINAMKITNGVSATTYNSDTLNVGSITYNFVDYSPKLKMYVTTTSTSSPYYIAYSYDAFDWNVAVTSTTEIRAARWISGLNMFIAVGTGGYIYKSTDGINWTFTVTQETSWTIFTGVAYSKHKGIVVISASNCNLYSYDAITWYQSDIHGVGPSNVVYANFCRAFFMTCGSNGLYKSTDGIRWFPVINSFEPTSTTNALCVSEELGMIVAGFNNGTTLNTSFTKYSTDGITWKHNAIAWGGDIHNYIMALTWIPELGMFLAAAQYAYLIYSYDGISWHGYAPTGAMDSGFMTMYGIAYSIKLGKICVRQPSMFLQTRPTGIPNMSGIGISCGLDAMGIGAPSTASGSTTLTLGSATGKMIRFRNTINSLESTMTFSNNILQINSALINLNYGTTLGYLTLGSTTANYYALSNLMSTSNELTSANTTPLKLAVTGSDSSLSGVLSTDSLYVDGSLFSISGNHASLPSTSAGTAVNNKLAVMNNGEFNINNVNASSAKLGTVMLTSESATNNTFSLDMITQRSARRHIDFNRAIPFETVANALQLINAGPGFNMTYYYIRDVETLFGVCGNTSATQSIYVATSSNFCNNTAQIVNLGTARANSLLPTSITNFIYIPEMKRYYICGTGGMVYSEDLVQFRHCDFLTNSTADINSIAYSPELRLYVTGLASGGIYVSRDGINFNPSLSYNARSTTATTFTDFMWVSQFGVFIGVASGYAGRLIYFSYNGYEWSYANTNSVPYTSITTTGKIAYSEQLNTAIIATSTGAIYKTTDGVNWTVSMINTGNYIIRSPYWEPALGCFIACTTLSVCIFTYSHDGTNWKFVNGNSTLTVTNVVYNGNTGCINAVSATAGSSFIIPANVIKSDSINPNNTLCEKEIKVDNVNNRVGIGKTPDYALELSRDSAYKPTTTTWATSSDERLKEDIQLADVSICYDNVQSIPLKRYTWKEEIYDDTQVNDRSQLGWIAQDVQPVIPKAVTQGARHGFGDALDLNTDQIIANLYGAVQYLQQQNEELDSMLALLTQV